MTDLDRIAIGVLFVIMAFNQAFNQWRIYKLLKKVHELIVEIRFMQNREKLQ